jgi:hypothetical protein
MRIWDIDPGFLNDRSLLGEHRELHGIVSIIRKKKTGYARHPETRRWKPHLRSLVVRHELLVEEMKLRGFKHRSPIRANITAIRWPSHFLDQPVAQYTILQQKYRIRPPGRIPLPGSVQELWARHKYSVMARSPRVYQETGARVARGEIGFAEAALHVVGLLRTVPPAGRLANAVIHMWGHVSDHAGFSPRDLEIGSLLHEIQRLTTIHNITYLWRSTALSELAFWCRGLTLETASA